MQQQWDFVIAAYAVTAFGALAVLGHSWRRMARAEARAAGLVQPTPDLAGPMLADAAPEPDR